MSLEAAKIHAGEVSCGLSVRHGARFAVFLLLVIGQNLLSLKVLNFRAPGIGMVSLKN